MSPAAKWVGLAKVYAAPGSDVLGPDAKGAFVTIIALANDAADFASIVRSALTGYGLILAKLEDVEPLELRLKSHQVDPTLLKDAGHIPQSTLFVFGSFHTYTEGGGSESAD
jgi:hypothetical protein